MIRNAGKVLILVGIALLWVVVWPWLSCMMDFPGNLTDLRITLGDDSLDPSSSSAGVCWQAYPAWADMGMLGVGLSTLLVGGLLAKFGGTGQRRADLPEHLKQEIAHRRRPVREPERNTNLTQRELEQGIEVNFLDEEDSLSGILRPKQAPSTSTSDSESESLGSSTIGDVMRLGEGREETLMDQVGIQISETRRMEAIQADEQATIDGFYSPQGMSHLPILYVDRDHEFAGADFGDDGAGLGRRDRPFETIHQAIARARQMVRDSRKGVQVRVMPGVYQEHVVLPPQVALVNHRMPAEGSAAERLAWLKTQQEVDHLDRVTILVPTTEKIGVRCDPGSGQGIYGCHIVGRKGSGQVGVKLSRSERVMMMNCVIEQFDQGGAFLEYSGSDLQVGGIRVEGCIFRENKAPEGGGLAATESALLVSDCLFERNASQRGGGLCLWGMRGLCLVKGCEFVENKSQLKYLPDESLEDIDPARWEEQEGLGGGLWVGSSQIKVVECRFARNGASVAGGALVGVASKVLLQGTQKDPLVIKENRARAGGGLFIVGGYDAESRSVVKMQHVECERNFGQRGGGALLATGGSTIQAEYVRLERNEGDETGSRGGGAYLLHGAELIGTQLLVYANRASIGGGIMSVNASVRLKDRSAFQDNVAQLESCGALYAGVQRSRFVEDAIGSGELRLPFVVKLLDVECVGNLAMEEPCAVGIGDVTHQQSVMMMGVELTDDVRLRANRVQGRPSDHVSHQDGALQIVWKGEARYLSEGLVARPIKVKLA